MKKIISYSLYGNKDLYCLGILESIDIINKYYSSWEIYIYYNDIMEELLVILKGKKNVKLFECISNGYKWEGMFWRFYPLEYLDVDIVISRDADSRINDREMELVNEWINSDKCFHIIRDHEGHRIEILGGTWGVKIKEFNKIAKINKINEYIQEYYKYYPKDQERQPDQLFLREIIYPFIKNNNLTHISLEELRYSDKDIIIQRGVNYVGQVIDNLTYKIKRGILYFHQGWTDIMNCLSLINYYCNMYDVIYLIVRKDSKNLINYYIKNLNVIPVFIEKCFLDGINNLKEIVDIEKYIDNSDLLCHGGHDKYRNDKYKNSFEKNGDFFVRAFYLSYNINYNYRIDYFKLERNFELENNLYDKFIEKYGEKYILCHKINKELINNNLLNNVNYIELSEGTNTFFDYIKILEYSIELHLIDSVWGILVYLLDCKYKLFKNKKIYLYATRGYSSMFCSPYKLENWIIISDINQ